MKSTYEVCSAHDSVLMQNLNASLTFIFSLTLEFDNQLEKTGWESTYLLSNPEIETVYVAL